MKEEQYCESLATFIINELFGIKVKQKIYAAFNIVKLAIKHMFKVNLNYIKLVISPYPHYNTGKINKDMPSEEYGGSYCYNQKIYINPNYKSVWNHYHMLYNDTNEDITK